MDRHSEYNNPVLEEMARVGLEKGWIKKTAYFRSRGVKNFQETYNRLLETFPELQSKDFRLIKPDGIYGPSTQAASANLNEFLFSDKIKAYARRQPELADLLGSIRTIMQHDFDQKDPRETSIVFDEFWVPGIEKFVSFLASLKKVVPLQKVIPFPSANQDLGEPNVVGELAKKYFPQNEQDTVNKDIKFEPMVVERSKPSNLGFEPMVIERSKPKIPTNVNNMEFPPDIDVGGKNPVDQKAKQYFPEGVETNNDGIYANVKHTIISEAKDTIKQLVTLATDLDRMGATAEAISIDKQLRAYKQNIGNILKESGNELYDIFKETGEQLVNSAHRGGGVTIAPAADEGGKVETIVEEQKKMIDKATKAPTGKLASTVHELIALANRLDRDGKEEAAHIVDKTIRDIVSESPFVGRDLVIEATNPYDFNASIKKEANSADAIKKWDSAVTKLTELASDLGFALGYYTLKSTLTGKNPLVEDVKIKYREAFSQINLVATLWEKGMSPLEIGKRINLIIETLTIDDPADVFSSIYLQSAGATKATIKYNTMMRNFQEAYAILLNNTQAPVYPVSGQPGSGQPVSGQPVTKKRDTGLDNAGNIRDFQKYYYNRFAGTVDEVINLLRNPNYQDKFEKYFGSPDLVAKAIQDLQKWKTQAITFPATELKKLHKQVYYNLLKKFQFAVKSSVKKVNIRKIAEITSIINESKIPFAPPTVQSGKSGKGNSGKGRSGITADRSDPRVEAFQKSMKSVGFGGNLATRTHPDGIDGIWGERTAWVWNEFRKKLINEGYEGIVNKNMPEVSVQKNKLAIPAEIDKVTNIANNYIKRGKAITFNVDGQIISTRDLQNLKSFMGLVDKINASKAPIISTTSLLNRRISKRAAPPPATSPEDVKFQPSGSKKELLNPLDPDRDATITPEAFKNMKPKVDEYEEAKKLLAKISDAIEGEEGGKIGIENGEEEVNRIRQLIRNLYSQMRGEPVQNNNLQTLQMLGYNFEQSGQNVIITKPDGTKQTITLDFYNQYFGQNSGQQQVQQQGQQQQGQQQQVQQQLGPQENIRQALAELPSWDEMRDPAMFADIVTTKSTYPQYTVGANGQPGRINEQDVSVLRKGLGIDWSRSKGKEIPAQKFFLALKFIDMYKVYISHIINQINLYAKRGTNLSNEKTEAMRKYHYLNGLEDEVKNQSPVKLPDIREPVGPDKRKNYGE